mgnify:FL=1
MKDKDFVITSPLKQQLLLFLVAGCALALTRSPRSYFRVISALPRELRKIRRGYLYQILREFEQERLISWKESRNGMVTAIITERWKKKTLSFSADSMQITKPRHWDKIWRLVLFDIPERKRPARDALRDKLRELGFYQLQRSAFILPYPCREEIEFLVELFEIRLYVYYMEVYTVSNEAKLKLVFKI